MRTVVGNSRNNACSRTEINERESNDSRLSFIGDSSSNNYGFSRSSKGWHNNKLRRARENMLRASLRLRKKNDNALRSRMNERAWNRRSVRWRSSGSGN